MLILAVDTALGQESCTIIQYGEILSFSQGDQNSMQAEKLFDHINKVLSESKFKLDNIDYFAADIGPGSFTGVRIGLSAILGICAAQNKKFIGVTSLEALAYKAASKNTKNISVAINAGKDEAYFQEFETVGEIVKTTQKPEVIGFSRIITASIGNIKECKIQAVPDARDIGYAAYKMIRNNVADLSRKSPMYIREPDAKISNVQ